ncbi:glycosyltransferase [Flavitalea antarctica]
MNKLSIGIILKEGYTPELGGGFSYFDSVVEAIDNYEFHEDLDFSFISFTPVAHAKFKKRIDYINVQDYFSWNEKMIFRLTKRLKKNSSFYKLNIIKALKTKLTNRENKYLRDALIAKKIDIIYNIVPFAQFLDYPFVETHWDIGHFSMFAFPEVTMNGVFEKRDKYYSQWVSKAFAIFCESDAGKEELLSYKPINPERIFVVPMFAGKITGLNLAKEVIDSILLKYDLESDRYFFYPAQFWSHKNHYGLLVAFKKFTKKYPGIRMVFTGSDKGNLGYIKTVIKELELENEVVLTGFVSTETLYAFYKTAISLVMASYLGPTNLPLLEAQAIGCPVICNDFKGHRELLPSGSNIFVPTGDTESLSQAMETMHNLKSPRTGIRNERFTKENCMKSIESGFLRIRNARKLFGWNFKQY